MRPESGRKGNSMRTIEELSRGIEEGRWTCESLVRDCLHTILADDRQGLALHTIAELNPDALFEAQSLDEEIRTKGRRGPLHGVPVLLKDNIDVKGMHTTAGSLALQDLIAAEDAFLTARLRAAGALILGKTNLSEFAYFMSTRDMPNGYSSRGGQVINAYDPAFDPRGSSTGSAVAVSARFVPYAIGTETDGSLMSPAVANSITTIKPTVGLVSRRGILPISHIQDTAGPMALCVADLAAVLQVIAGADEQDAATRSCHVSDYTAAVQAGVKGMRIGIYRDNPTAADEAALARAKDILTAGGAEVIDVEIPCISLDELEVMKHEFKQGLNLYLSRHNSRCRTLTDIIAYNRAHPETCLVHGQDLLESSDACSGTLSEPEYIRQRLELKDKAEELLDGTLAAHCLDVLLSAGGRPKGNLAPVAGRPCLSLPAVKVSQSAYSPLNYCMMAAPWREDLLFRTARVLEEALQIENIPEGLAK